MNFKSTSDPSYSIKDKSKIFSPSPVTTVLNKTRNVIDCYAHFANG